MKFWEALKAIDEGKTVEFKEPLLGVWGTWIGTSSSTELRTLRTLMSWEWRIKPEPKVLYVACRNNGEHVGVFNTLGKANRAIERLNEPATYGSVAHYRPYFIKKFIEAL